MNRRAKIRIRQIIERNRKGDTASILYDVVMISAIIVSLIPLVTRVYYPIFLYFEIFSVTLFIIDYILRWITADLALGKGKRSYLIYPFTFMAVIDMLSILPILAFITKFHTIFRISGMFRALRMLHFLRYSKQMSILGRVLRRERKILFSVFGLAIMYIFTIGVLLFNAEPDVDPITGVATFNNFFEALYCATMTLTTVGYGDVSPTSEIGRAISMLSSLVGVAIIALPSGIITASYLSEIHMRNTTKKENNNGSNNQN